MEAGDEHEPVIAAMGARVSGRQTLGCQRIQAEMRYTVAQADRCYVMTKARLTLEQIGLYIQQGFSRLGIGRSKIYELMRLGDLRSVKIGGCRRITRAALAEFVAGLEAMAS